MNDRPNKFALRFLRWFCPEHLLEEIEGDLIQKYERDVKTFGERKARRRFVWNVIRFFRPGILLRNKIVMNSLSVTLLRNYFKISYRYMAKNKTFAIVNVFGLALGMAAALLIYQYVSFEKSYDTGHKNFANIYRVTTEWNPDITPQDKRATTVPWSGPGVKEAFPEVIEYTRFAPLSIMTGANSVRHEKLEMDETAIYLADPGFLKIFSFHLLEGDPETALSNPQQIILTESIARKYFGDEPPLGKSLFIDSHGNLSGSDYKVTGIIQDPPLNSHLSFDFLISYTSMWASLADGSTYWHWDNTYCYLLLHPDTQVDLLERKIADVRVKNFGKEFGIWNDVVEFKLQPLKDIHLYSSLKGEVSLNGNGKAIRFLMIVGVFILISAYINYINLTTVKAIERRTEIGIRKIIGSTRIQLILQLLMEAIIINGMAVVLALGITWGSVPAIESIFNIQWPGTYSQVLSTPFLITVGLLVPGGIFLSALYPSFVLTRFKPVEVLKGGKMVSAGSGNRWSFRKSLITMQFIFCIAFTTGTYVLLKQLKYMKDHDLGMNMDQVVVVRAFGFQPYEDYKNFKAYLSSVPQIDYVGSSSAAPGDEIMMLGLRPKVKVGSATESTELKMVSADDEYFKTLKIEFTAGRNFDPFSKSEVDAVILNEAAAELLGYDDPSKIIQEPLYDELNDRTRKVIGVIKNYHQRSLQNAHEPIVFVPNFFSQNNLGWNKFYYFVRLRPDVEVSAIPKVITEIETAWKSTSSDRNISYFFLDSYFESYYKSEATFGSLFLFFSCLAVFIACLGLFGVVSYTTLQRTKEIGIRKVLGATVQSILMLLCKDFALLILMATCFAIPVVAFMLNNWLESYAFRINLDIGLFGYPVLVVFSLALLTVMLKSLGVATLNPVNNLRSE